MPLRDGPTGLSTEEWLHVLGQISSLSFITFTGGEAFWRKDFMEDYGTDLKPFARKEAGKYLR